jgi:peptide-methionine (R)-S-oxide reductase
MRRRRILTALAGFSAVPLITPTFPIFAAAIGSSSIESIQTRWRTLLAKSASIATDAQPLGREASSWRADLPAGSFEVLFEEDTERPFSSHLNYERRPGVFVCRACDLPLFSSEMKYDSGTGWPSFFTTIPHHLATKTDFKLIWPRTEYHCVKCDGHQGHIFEDGPQPTGERWCNNGAALRFIPE